MKNLVLGLSLALFGVTPVWSSTTYPERPITMVVPFPAGSTTDAMTRFLSKEVEAELGQTLVVENKAGAQGSIAAAYVSRAKADGYTLLVGTNSTQSANVHLFKDLSYDPAKDFAAITQFTMNPLVLVVREDLPVKTLPEFLEYAKSRPGKLNYGVGNSGSLASVQMLKDMTGIDAMDIQYAGTPQAITDLIAGRLDFMITDISVTRPYVEAGKLRALGVTPIKTTRALPNVPTMHAAGLSGYDFVAWGGLFAPEGTDPAIVDRLNKAFVNALKSPRAAEFFDRQGQEAFPRSPNDFTSYVSAQTDMWGALLAKTGRAKQ
ncbi:tripartite tricarboxylate transporter substrate binding protein [Allopusillimonas ginsengisoli]|nr:tripartite tricarboxylate transporter substrate binding protein [Allopusillimonas ginsengisoli]